MKIIYEGKCRHQEGGDTAKRGEPEFGSGFPNFPHGQRRAPFAEGKQWNSPDTWYTWDERERTHVDEAQVITLATSYYH